MRTIMSNFYYYFQLAGTKGGLSSLDWEFSFAPSQGENAQDVQKAARSLARKHTDLFDRLYSEVLSGEKTPIMQDGGWTLGMGYEYSGQVKTKSVSSLKKCLGKVFQVEAIDVQEKISPRSVQYAQVQYLMRNRNPADAGLEIKARLGHPLSVCLFQFLQGIEGVEVEDDVNKRMEYLKRTLKDTRERDGLDYYKILTEEGSIAA